MSLSVLCDCCGKDFDALFVDEGKRPTQAYGCACEVTGGRLIGHFGSAYDMTTFIAIDNPLTDGQVVCDGCVAAMQTEGRIKECEN